MGEDDPLIVTPSGSAGSPTRKRVTVGLERLLQYPAPLRGKRLGLIVNPTSIDREFRHAADRLAALAETELAVLFAPEHGIRGHAQDQIEIGDEVDARTALPVKSLYGPERIPSPTELAGVDVLVFDIQDVGSRYYTFIWTMAHAMEACAREGLSMIVCDRPNPISGELVEGNLIQATHRSFVGLYPIPNRHGLTVGELARLFNEEFGIGCDLMVIPMEGWRRPSWLDETDLPWVMPSPNMPTLDTATVYPGACLIEGTNLSEGRGTTRPFEIVGAPWIDAYRLVSELEKEELPGVVFRPLQFQPTFHKFAGQVCGGLQQHVLDRRAYRPLRTGISIVSATRRLWPREFAWRPPPYEYENERLAFDILAGNDTVRNQIEGNVPPAEIEKTWQPDVARFKRLSEPYLLYGK